jgi:hypothetical protein
VLESRYPCPGPSTGTSGDFVAARVLVVTGEEDVAASGVEPTPETVEAIYELDRRSRGVGEPGEAPVVPELVGVSIALLDQGLAFTFVATSARRRRP